MSVLNFLKWKQDQRKISMLTCYDYWTAQLVNASSVDALLVGDSAAMVMHGETSTLPATTEMIASHVRAVAKGAPSKFIVADMPFLSYRGDLNQTVSSVDQLMKAGAHAVKLEGIAGNQELILHLVQSGVPVMGHLGLTPQSVHTLGGYQVQGRDNTQQEEIYKKAQQVQDAGCFSLVLECVPTELGTRITKDLNIPTIGIGAGPNTDGQILVMQDMLGAFAKNAKFVRKYGNIAETLKHAFDSFDQDVKKQTYPSADESYS